MTRIECVSATVDSAGEAAIDWLGESLDRDVIQKARPFSNVHTAPIHDVTKQNTTICI